MTATSNPEKASKPATPTFFDKDNHHLLSPAATVKSEEVPLLRSPSASEILHVSPAMTKQIAASPEVQMSKRPLQRASAIAATFSGIGILMLLVMQASAAPTPFRQARGNAQAHPAYMGEEYDRDNNGWSSIRLALFAAAFLGIAAFVGLGTALALFFAGKTAAMPLPLVHTTDSVTTKTLSAATSARNLTASHNFTEKDPTCYVPACAQVYQGGVADSPWNPVNIFKFLQMIVVLWLLIWYLPRMWMSFKSRPAPKTKQGGPRAEASESPDEQPPEDF